jgi:hypothetical protein
MCKLDLQKAGSYLTYISAIQSLKYSTAKANYIKKRKVVISKQEPASMPKLKSDKHNYHFAGRLAEKNGRE